jgi:hypothetical protein
MDFKKHLETAWNLLLKHIVPLVLMTLVMFVLGGVTLGILAPVMMAGYFHAIILMLRTGREPTVGDLFSQMHLFLPLLVFGIVVGVVAMIGFSLLFLPGLAVIVAVAFGCLYMLPLMTENNMGLIDAIKASWQMAMQDSVADHVVVVILFVGLTSIGSSLVFIGSLFTQPFASIFILSVFLERAGALNHAATAPPPPPGEAGPTEG